MRTKKDNITDAERNELETLTAKSENLINCNKFIFCGGGG